MIFHYTNKKGYDGIRSAPTWRFLARKPPKKVHPTGAYFTDLPETTPCLTQLLRIPRRKTEFFFEFKDGGDLHPLRGFRGNYVFYSPRDYVVAPLRQRRHGRRAG